MATAKKETSDKERIKAMFSELSNNAIAAITTKSDGSVMASSLLHTYSKHHAEWLDAQVDASQCEVGTKEKLSGVRKTAGRLKKFQDLHNRLINRFATRGFSEKYARAKSDSAFKKLADAEDAKSKASLQESGIGDRLYRAA